jgi:hypothetical protein
LRAFSRILLKGIACTKALQIHAVIEEFDQLSRPTTFVNIAFDVAVSCVNKPVAMAILSAAENPSTGKSKTK